MIPKFHILAFFALLFISCQHKDSDNLATSFKDPPDDAKPWLYWYWIDENISKEGISHDLEAMARVGIGQALIGHVSPGGARGNVKILSEEWWSMVEHAVEEGQRLGVDIGFFNGPGWSQSGGPWIQKGQSMRHIISREFKLTGPSLFKEKITFPDISFERIALQAFPVRLVDQTRIDPVVKNILTNPVCPEAENLFDGKVATQFLFPSDLYSGRDLSIDILLENPVPVQTIQFDFLPVNFSVEIEILAKAKNDTFEKIRSFTLDRRYINFEIGPMRYKPAVFSLPIAESDHFRIKLSDLIASEGAGFRDIDLMSSAGIDQRIEKQLGKMFSGPLPPWEGYLWPGQPEPSPEFILNKNDIIDITSEIDAHGNIEWEVPDGDWILLQSGMVPTGATNVPVPPEATGYECDKFTDEAIQTHFNAYIGKFLEKVPEEKRKSFKTVVIDSYEVGPQNWSNDFRDTFLHRYGYDPIPWLPVFSGRIIESADLSNRFLWDIRRLTADLISNVYVKGLREMCHDHGLDLWLENYGHWGFPAEFLQYGGQADKISGEFWYENTLWDLGPLECRAASSAAHIYGKKQVFAEAFTAGFNFRQYPAIMKSKGDQMFCEGINQMVQHVYIHQPWENKKPGVIAWFGMSYQRHNTWFEQSNAWNEYLQRCHFLLQQGVPVSDVCYFIGEDAPKMTGILNPDLPAGYDYDFINADVIMNRLSVKDGLLKLPDGKSYRLIVLPPLETMRPEILKQVWKLLKEGACIYGPPPSRSPSLENYPEADREVERIASELWGDMERNANAYQKIGIGTLFNTESLEYVFEKLNISPDVIVQDTSILWTHRRSKEADIYFISNQEDMAKTVDISFRVSGKIPEFWHPETGETEKMALFHEEKERTLVPLTLDPHGSVFVVFRNRVSGPTIQTVTMSNQNALTESLPSEEPVITYLNDDNIKVRTSKQGDYTLHFTNDEKMNISTGDIPSPFTIDGPWRIRFPEHWDAPTDTTFDQLISWSDHQDTGIRHFSGTAVYHKAINIPDNLVQPDLHLVLDLGAVIAMAEVIVNGHNLGILWKKPYKIDITKYVRAGENDIEIKVTNTWWNRLVGDEKYPEGFPGSLYNQSRTFTTHKAWNWHNALVPSGLIGPVTLYIEKQCIIPR